MFQIKVVDYNVFNNITKKFINPLFNESNQTLYEKYSHASIVKVVKLHSRDLKSCFSIKTSMSNILADYSTE